MEIAILLGLALFGLLSIASIPVGLPGLWIYWLVAVGVEVFDSHWAGPEHETFGWWALGAVFVFALVAEGIEAASGFWGARKGGGSKRGAWWSLGGGLLGAMIGTFAIPVPLVGSLLGALMGTFAGAMYGEMSGENAKDKKDAMRPAIWATLSRVLALATKTAFGVLGWVTLTVASVLPLLG